MAIKENNEGSGGGNNKCRFESLKPVMFEYAYAQKSSRFEGVFYDYVDNVNKIQGESIVERSQINAACLTKTKVQRESDDSSDEDLMVSVTKTNTQREVDDTTRDDLVLATTKTFVQRESDDGIDPYVLLLTKTEQPREADE